MNLRQIRELVRLLESSSLSVLEIEEADLRVRLEKGQTAGLAQPVSAALPQAVPAALPVETAPAPAPVADGTVDFNRLKEVKSPLVGIFYAAPSPGAEPFAGVGSRVKKGDVLCVVEAMKLMNEITADVDGEVIDVCVQNGQVVEFGQILFKLY
ncbi:MAG: acetyl-CoA carboxylase biotin carboxyl carrier protein [Clostridiales bacterium]|nr:acetyl-CoA carboxylase biotin carboxyl carrier protein [Clostridiales bacterium]